MTRPAAVALLIGIAMTSAGCSAGVASWGVNGVDPDAPAPAPAASVWTCSYLPTMDDDWHNDVLCTNGTEEQRPYLLEGDDFITEDEIMQAAREYETVLNGG
ncbi:hypothetical protein WJX64_14980 [Leifsonia sp. YIM 134122]|uniref:Uncharacterized protein n=1 Tax=Leifsonia stereocauli TaxID=3134136 RepID=A0ABU9W886_9MICO